MSLNSRLEKLEQKAAPPRVLVLWPGDPDPDPAELEGVEVIRVEYVKDWRGSNEPVKWPNFQD
jgi:hypothetical protein